MLTEVDELTTYDESHNSSESDKWLEAMKPKMDSMCINQVWTLVEPPEEIKPIGRKWIFKKMTYMEGNVITYKARLVAKVYHQRQGIDYDKTLSPVGMLRSIKILLAIDAHRNYEIWKMDVKTSFRKGNQSKDVCKTKLEFFTPRNGIKVCKLQRSIYGLKQASRSFNMRFNETIKEFGFSQNSDEPYVYKKDSGSAVIFLVLYVDDIQLLEMASQCYNWSIY